MPILALLLALWSPLAWSADTLRVQLPAAPRSLDPWAVADAAGFHLAMNLLDGLIGYDATGKLVPKLAASHTISKDGKRFEFTLRKGTRWSDGTPILPEHFVAGFRRALDPKQPGSDLIALFFIRGAKAYFAGKAKPEELAVREERGKLVIELEHPFPAFLQYLNNSNAYPAPIHWLKEAGRKPGCGMPTSGAYRLVSCDPQTGFTLERNPHYWGTPAIAERVELLIVANEATAASLFEAGRLDLLVRILPHDLTRLSKLGTLVRNPTRSTYFLMLRPDAPGVRDVALRRRFLGALKRDQLVAALGTGDLPAMSFVPPGMEGHEALSAPKAAARAPTPAITPIPAFFPASERNALLFEKLQADLRAALQLPIELNPLETGTYWSRLETDPPPVFMHGLLSPMDDPLLFYRRFTSTADDNFPRWKNAEFDRLFEEVQALAPGRKRADKLKRMSRLLILEDAVLVPLFHQTQAYVFATKRVARIRPNPYGFLRLCEVELKK